MRPNPRSDRSESQRAAPAGAALRALVTLAWGLPTLLLLASLCALCCALLFVPPFVVLLPLCVEGTRRVAHAVARSCGPRNAPRSLHGAPPAHPMTA